MDAYETFAFSVIFNAFLWFLQISFIFVGGGISHVQFAVIFNIPLYFVFSLLSFAFFF